MGHLELADEGSTDLERRDWCLAPQVAMGVAALILGAVGVVVVLGCGVALLRWALELGSFAAGELSVAGTPTPGDDHIGSLISGIGIATWVLGCAAVLSSEAWVCAAEIGRWILRGGRQMGEVDDKPVAVSLVGQ